MSTNPFRVLRHRDYAVFWVAAVTSDIGTWMQMVTVGIIVADETGKASSTGLIAAAAIVPQFFAAPIGGVVADRFDRRNVLRLSLAAQAAVTIVLSVLLTADHPSPGWMALVVLLQNSFNSLGQPSSQAMLPDLVPREELISAVALTNVSWNAGRIAGPAMAGLVIAVADPAWVIRVNAVSFLVLFVALSALRRSFRPPEGTIHLGFGASLAQGVRVVRDSPSLRMIARLAMLAQFALVPLAALLPIVARNRFHGGSGLTAVLTTGHGLGCLIGAALAPTMIAHFGRSRSLAMCAISSAVLAPVVVSSPWRAGAVISVVLYGIVMMSIFVSMMGATQRDAPAASRGRVLSLLVSLWGLLYGIAVLSMGALSDRFGLRTSFIVWAVVVSVAYANMIWRNSDSWKLLDHNDAPPLRRLNTAPR